MYKFVTITAAVVIASTVHSLAQSAAPHDQHIINIENDGRSVFATSTGQRSYGVNLATQREVDGLRSAIRGERARIDQLRNDVPIIGSDGGVSQRLNGVDAPIVDLVTHDELDTATGGFNRRIRDLEDELSDPSVNNEYFTTLEERVSTLEGGTTTTTGPRGPAGPTGAAGRDGTNGTDGRDGMNGRDGTDGTNGTNGRDGTNGARGAKGDRGYRGEAGQDANTDAVFRGIAGATALNFANQGGAGLGFGLGSFEGQTAAAISVTYDFDPNASISFGASSGGNVGGGFKLKF